MFLMNQWYAAALPHELTHRPLARTICDKALVLFRGASGEVAALDDRCPHRYAPLSEGSCSGDTIACPYHGIVFDTTGQCVRIPQQDNIPGKMRVRSYPLIERWGWAWIWMGDLDRADPALIPPYEWFGSPDWKGHIYRYWHVDANWELCADNLLDLSHVGFIHQKTIGVNDHERFPLEVKSEGDRVTSRRFIRDVPPSAHVKHYGNFAGNIDRVSAAEWRAPGNISVEQTYMDAKTKIRVRLTNPLTPETERTTHLWFTWSRDFGVTDDARYVETFVEKGAAIQAEDNAFMLLQQRVIDRERGNLAEAVAIQADAALLAARRVVGRLRREEEALRQRVSA